MGTRGVEALEASRTCVNMTPWEREPSWLVSKEIRRSNIRVAVRPLLIACFPFPLTKLSVSRIFKNCGYLTFISPRGLLGLRHCAGRSSFRGGARGLGVGSGVPASGPSMRPQREDHARAVCAWRPFSSL